MSCDCYCSVALPQSATGWSVVCYCGTFVSNTQYSYVEAGSLNQAKYIVLEDLLIRFIVSLSKFLLMLLNCNK